MDSTMMQSHRIKRGEIYQLPNNKFSFVCVHCSNEFQYFNDFTLHVQKHLDTVLQPVPSNEIQHCTVKIEKFRRTLAHSSIDEPLIDVNEIKVLNESGDDYEFNNDFTNEYENDLSDNSMREDSIKKKKLSESQFKFECFICHKKLSKAFAVKRHMTIHKFNDLQCKICNENFRTSRYLERHISMRHPNNTKFESQLPITEEPIKKQRIYECNYCQKCFRDRRQLQNHKVVHRQRPCLCLVCGQLFSGDRTLNRHMKLHDSPDETHPCTKCERTFTQRRYLMEHNRKVHKSYADNEQIACGTCDQQFENKRALQIHMQSHPYVQQRNFKCSICTFAATCAYDLRRHMETHNIENRSFECEICHKKFLPRYANDHMKSHDSTRNFECQECGQTFKRAKSLKRHQASHGGGPTFKCDVCSKEFARNDGLLRHRRRHGVAMNYHCRICNKGFIEQTSFLVHESGHSKGSIKTELIPVSLS